jgi:hypothetical protein
MTRVQTHTRNDQAIDTIDEVIRGALKAPAPVRWSVAAVDNHSGEPSFYVYVEMPSENDIPDIGAQNRLVVMLLAALEEIDDHRFPYVSYGPREGDSDVETTHDPDED